MAIDYLDLVAKLGGYSGWAAFAFTAWREFKRDAAERRKRLKVETERGFGRALRVLVRFAPESAATGASARVQVLGGPGVLLRGKRVFQYVPGLDRTPVTSELDDDFLFDDQKDATFRLGREDAGELVGVVYVGHGGDGPELDPGATRLRVTIVSDDRGKRLARSEFVASV